MFAILELTSLLSAFTHPVGLAFVAFQIWMLIDAVRRAEWLWVVWLGLSLMFFFIVTPLLYFFLVYRQAGPAGGGRGLRGFELPGAGTRQRIRELEGRIHHLDKARDHLDLADIYFSQGKLTKAEASYRASLERDPTDVDAVAHLGQCLLRQNRPAEAKPLLERALAVDPRHDYAHTLMALAETQTALGEQDAALRSWERVLSSNSYARARVQFAELLASRGEKTRARGELNEVIIDDQHAPKFQRARDKVWLKRAHSLLRKL